MKRFIPSFLFLFWAAISFAHEGEEVEEHAEMTVETAVDIGPIFFAGVLGLFLISFVIWLLVKK